MKHDFKNISSRIRNNTSDFKYPNSLIRIALQACLRLLGGFKNKRYRVLRKANLPLVTGDVAGLGEYLYETLEDLVSWYTISLNNLYLLIPSIVNYFGFKIK